MSVAITLVPAFSSIKALPFSSVCCVVFWPGLNLSLVTNTWALDPCFSHKDLISFLKDYFAKEDVELIVIGEPKQKDGTYSDVEVCIKNFILKLVKAFPTLRIERMDERFTSKIALKTMIESGLSKKKRQNKYLVDEISATIILQSYLYSK